MTLTLEIAPEIQRALEEKAQHADVPLTAYAASILARDATGDNSGNGSSQSNGAGHSAEHDDPFFAELDALAAQFLINAPPLADDAVAPSYEEWGAAQL